MFEAERKPPIHPNKLNFIEGLSLVLERWVALKMALEMEWGGHDTARKSDEFKAALVDYFEREGKSIEPEDIEEILLEVMCNEFGTILEDNSEVQVARQICTLYQECIKGKTDLLNTLRARRSQPLPLDVVRPEDSSSEEEAEESDDEGRGGGGCSGNHMME